MITFPCEMANLLPKGSQQNWFLIALRFSCDSETAHFLKGDYDRPIVVNSRRGRDQRSDKLGYRLLYRFHMLFCQEHVLRIDIFCFPTVRNIGGIIFWGKRHPEDLGSTKNPLVLVSRNLDAYWNFPMRISFDCVTWSPLLSFSFPLSSPFFPSVQLLTEHTVLNLIDIILVFMDFII